MIQVFNVRNLLNNPDVLFSGYRVPHPLEYKIEIKIQTNGKIKPVSAFANSLDNITAEFDSMNTEFNV